MILFIAPNPFKYKFREGYLQRVAAIDSLFKDEEKLYFDDFEDASEATKAMLKARMIYVHSIYQAERIIVFYPYLAEKIVTDMHGVVPEEELYSGNIEKSKHMEKIEAEVFKYGKVFVSVSNSMAEHFTKKYKLPSKVQWVTLPIFNQHKVSLRDKNVDQPTVIYAGGTQQWQNVSLMVDSINESYKKYNFTVLTHSTEAFNGISMEAGSKTILRSAPSVEVGGYYRKAVMGFILRDDIVINNVACPTKIIEYLGYGVVPIVLSPNIGDFKALGYSYVLLEDFVKRDIPADELKRAVSKNYEVLESLHQIAEDGKANLRNTFKTFKASSKKINIDERLMEEIIRLTIDKAALTERLQGYGNQIEAQAKAIEEYAETINRLQKSIDDLVNSKRWVLVESIRNPKNLRKLRKRHN